MWIEGSIRASTPSPGAHYCMQSSFQRSGSIPATCKHGCDFSHHLYPVCSYSGATCLPLQPYITATVTAASIPVSFSLFQPHVNPFPSEPAKGQPCTHRQLLHARKPPACRWCALAAQWERTWKESFGSDKAKGRVQQQEGRWQPWKSCTACAAEVAVLCTGGQD